MYLLLYIIAIYTQLVTNGSALDSLSTFFNFKHMRTRLKSCQGSMVMNIRNGIKILFHTEYIFDTPVTKLGGVYWIHPVCLSVHLSVLSWMILSKQKNLHLFYHNTFVFSLRRLFVHVLFVSWGATGWRFIINSRANIHVTIDCSTVLPLVLGVVTRQKP